MAGVVTRLIRHIVGTAAEPANIQNKQLKVDVDDNGSSRDRSKLVVKDNSGVEHTWITVDEIQDYVTTQINSTSGINTISPFVIVTNASEFSIAMGDPFVLNIWCEDLDFYSDAGSAFIGLNLKSSKNIYANRPKGITFSGSANHVLQHNFPTSAAIQDIVISYFCSIGTEVSAKSCKLAFLEGYSGHGYDHSINVQRFYDDSSGQNAEVYLTKSGYSANGNVYVEINDTNRSLDNTTDGIEFKLFSGKNSGYKFTKYINCTDDVLITEIPADIMSRSDIKTNIQKYNIYEFIVGSDFIRSIKAYIKNSSGIPVWTHTGGPATKEERSLLFCSKKYYSEAGTLGDSVEWLEEQPIYVTSKNTSITISSDWDSMDFTLPAGVWKVTFRTTMNKGEGESTCFVEMNGTYTVHGAAGPHTPYIILNYIDANIYSASESIDFTSVALITTTESQTIGFDFQSTSGNFSSLYYTTAIFERLHNGVTIN